MKKKVYCGVWRGWDSTYLTGDKTVLLVPPPAPVTPISVGVGVGGMEGLSVITSSGSPRSRSGPCP